MPTDTSPSRRRLTSDARRAQLLDATRSLIRDEGTDALTLGRVAERAGVAKPLVYRHFVDRHGLLADLYREFDARQHRVLDAALLDPPSTLEGVAALVADSYLDCAEAEGVEMADVLDALSGSQILEHLRRSSVDAYIAKCRRALAPFAPGGTVPVADLHAFVGAADALARAVGADLTTPAHARTTLTRVITTLTAGAAQPTAG